MKINTLQQTADPSSIRSKRRATVFTRHLAIPCLFFLSLLCALPALSAQTQAVARLDSNLAETGNPFRLHISVPDAAGKPLQLDFSAWKDVVPEKNILKQSGWHIEGEGWINDLTLIVFDAADTLMLPGLSIRFDGGGTARCNPVELRVVPTPSPDDPVDMHGIKDIHREPVMWIDYLPWALGVGGVLLLLILMYWLANRRQRRKTISRGLGLPPHELARRKLAALAKKELWQNGLTKNYYAELTFIIREYVQQRFSVPALESSTTETIRRLKNSPDFPQFMLPALQDVLQQADLVKFAKARPPASFNEQAIQTAHIIVEQTVPVPVTTADKNA